MQLINILNFNVEKGMKKMFFEKKYYLEKKEQDCTNFVLKALPQYLALKERKRLKDEIIEIKLLAQLNDDIIPNFENADYIYRNIMYIEIIVNNINRVQSYIEILHKLFKAPTILKISDTKQNYLYSFSVKRLNKLDNENIVIEHIINTTQSHTCLIGFNFIPVTFLLVSYIIFQIITL